MTTDPSDLIPVALVLLGLILYAGLCVWLSDFKKWRAKK